MRLDDTSRALIFVGILGGFTTFSSLGLDTLTLMRTAEAGMALANVVIQVGLGLAAVYIGFAMIQMAGS